MKIKQKYVSAFSTVVLGWGTYSLGADIINGKEGAYTLIGFSSCLALGVLALLISVFLFIIDA